MKSPSALFRLLGDEARLRMIRLLERERLNVSELVQVLGSAQSGVSRHLRLLKEAGVVEEDRRGGWAFYRLAPGAVPEGLLAEVRSGRPDDDARLRQVLRLRQDRAPDGPGRPEVPGRSWPAWARALGLLLPRLRVADLGCGDGHLACEAGAWARSVVGVDRSPALLARARELAARRKLRRVRFREGTLEALPLKDRSADLALAAQVLHCVPHPAAVLREARRILVPGGRVLVLELRPHREEWVRDRLGHVWLGFDRIQLGSLLESAGFRRVRVRPGDARRGEPFGVILACGERAEGRP